MEVRIALEDANTMRTVVMKQRGPKRALTIGGPRYKIRTRESSTEANP